MKNAFGRIAIACWSGGLLAVSAAAQNPTYSLIPDGDYLRECVGGSNEGAVCNSAADCCAPAHACEGGSNDGAACITEWVDCPGGACVQQCFCGFVITADPGDEILSEIYASDWSPEDQGLYAWEAKVDLNGFYSGDTGELALLKGARPCTGDLECVDIYARCIAGVCDDPPGFRCNSANDCQSWGPGNIPCVDRRCDVTEGVAVGVFIDLSRTDYIYYGISSRFDGMDLNLIRYSSTLIDSRDAPVYSPPPKYCGTLVLAVSDDAWGTFTVPLYPWNDSLMADENFVDILPIEIEPLMIRIGTPLPVSTDPPDCAIDARQTTEPDGSSPEGWDSIDFTFGGDISGVRMEDFGIRQVPSGGLGILISGITSVENTVTVNFNRRISQKKWTCVEYQPRSHEVCIAHLPTDVDGDTGDIICTASDILALIGCLSGVRSCDIWVCDLDRSGFCAAADVLRAVDLLHGAEAYSTPITPNGWLGEQMQNGTVCPTGP